MTIVHNPRRSSLLPPLSSVRRECQGNPRCVMGVGVVYRRHHVTNIAMPCVQWSRFVEITHAGNRTTGAAAVRSVLPAALAGNDSSGSSVAKPDKPSSLLASRSCCDGAGYPSTPQPFGMFCCGRGIPAHRAGNESRRIVDE